jgi:hypothetical protein
MFWAPRMMPCAGNVDRRRNSPTIYFVIYQPCIIIANRCQEALSQDGSGSGIENRDLVRSGVPNGLTGGLIAWATKTMLSRHVNGRFGLLFNGDIYIRVYI